MRFILLLLGAGFLWTCSNEKPKILVFSKTTGYRHESIETGQQALMALGGRQGFAVDTTEDASRFTEENLRQYQAVVFLCTTQDVLDKAQQGAFKRYIEAGGGFVGIHAAADTEYEWPWYGKLVGAYFKSHPKVQQATLRKQQDFGEHALPDDWVHTDEWYNYRNISPDIQVIYTLDESTYEGGENGEYHPIAWYHEFQGGRAFYTGLGHTKEAYSDELFLNHVLDGIRYAMGEQKGPDFRKAKSVPVAEDNRFTKTVLEFNLNEPTEMAILPDNRILFLERRGAVKMYTPDDGAVREVNRFDVYSQREDGMIGLTLDPDFKNNQWVYVFYSHATRSANVLSRFTFNGTSLDMNSETELLEVKTQRDECCHTGGSLAFGPDGNLFISTGDNTNPFESSGYSPSDERPGREPFDAQGSSGNPNDLRGKILRIRPQEDGSYTIPEGNLFAPDEPGTRPEIYVMGCRNPYRISIDERTGYLYWGEVGPDARASDSTRGPKGHDEVNQAKKAGFFGWPYFVGDNYAYARYDFASGKPGAFWNAEAPLNRSPNNTGKQELPPAQPAFIWYPYDRSPLFPMVKEGGRNAMAGPVYYSKNYAGVETAFPAYFDGKLMIYDWIRNWMFLVSMDEDGRIMDIEPFMQDTRFNNIIDMAYGPDGRLYMLEYGTVWFKQNIDARLVRIDYNGGNRPPVAALQANTTAGSVPLPVKFSAQGSMDHDQDNLAYVLEVGGQEYTSEDGNFEVTFDQPGVFTPVLKVSDGKGGETRATTQVIAGNEPPQVAVSLSSANTTFFFPGVAVPYEVKVKDKEDGETGSGISADQVKVSFDYIQGYDMTLVAQGHQQAPAALPGKILIAEQDCKSCHLEDRESAGPSYKMVAAKYKGDKDAVNKLAVKIIKGGGGVWGEREMAAHPQISVDDSRKMVEYILSLENAVPTASLPLAGKVTPGNQTEGIYALTATYQDRSPGNNLPSLTGTGSVLLRAPVLTPDQASTVHEASVQRQNGMRFVDRIRDGSYLVFSDIDLSYVKALTPVLAKYGDVAGGTVEVRLDAPDGKLIASLNVDEATRQRAAQGIETTNQRVQVEAVSGVHDIFVVFRNKDAGDRNLFYFSRIQVHPE